jgi:hypothetical protein
MKWFCRHNNVKLIRAHKNSLTGTKFKDKVVYVDVHNCVVFVHCADCLKFLNPVSHEQMFTEQIIETCSCCKGTGKVATK